MSRKINGRWYQRSWVEDTRAKAEAVAKSGLTSGRIARVVPEYYIVPAIPGVRKYKKELLYSVFTRPKHFSTVAASRAWTRAIAAMQDDDMRDKAQGQPYHILAR